MSSILKRASASRSPGFGVDVTYPVAILNLPPTFVEGKQLSEPSRSNREEVPSET